jgi:hypothetical protein
MDLIDAIDVMNHAEISRMDYDMRRAWIIIREKLDELQKRSTVSYTGRYTGVIAGDIRTSA